MLRLVLTGILAALFFSSTFVLNRAMSLEGGHWFWTASLRYGWMLVLLCIWLGVTGRAALGLRALQLFCKHWAFWTIAGSVGFGIFYALLSFSASYAPGWVVAATWQLTILATPIVLLLFGRRVSLRAVMFTLIVFAGVLLINIEQATAVPLFTVLLAALPVLGAAFAYPLGNQMVWEARIAAPEQHGPLVRRFIPTIDHPVMEDNICRVLLLTLGSFPLWGVLILWVSPPFASEGQLLMTLAFLPSSDGAGGLYLRRPTNNVSLLSSYRSMKIRASGGINQLERSLLIMNVRSEEVRAKDSRIAGGICSHFPAIW